MSIIRRGIDRERRSWTADPVIPPNSLAGALTYSGTTVTPDAALRISTVFACVRLLADSVSLTPLYVYENVNGIKSRVTDSAITSRLDDLFVDLNGDELPLWDGLQRWMTALALRGNAYAAVVSRDGRFPTKLLPLHPDDVIPKVHRDGSAIKGWTWQVSRQDWPTEDLIHIPLLTQGTGPLGIGPLESRETFGLALASQQFGATFFAQGATTSGVIEVPGSLSSDEARTLAAQWTSTRPITTPNGACPSATAGPCGRSWCWTASRPGSAGSQSSRSARPSAPPSTTSIPRKSPAMARPTARGWPHSPQQAISATRPRWRRSSRVLLA